MIFQVHVSGVQFSPTGRDFAAATTEGLLIYSLDTKLMFDPFELDEEITPATIKDTLKSRDFGKAVLMALKLNETDLIRIAVEHVPKAEIELITADMSEKYVSKMLKFVGGELEGSKHLHFYALWSHSLLLNHSQMLRTKSNDLMPIMNLMHKNLLQKSQDMTKICEHNIYTMDFLLTMGSKHDAVKKKEKEAAMMNEKEDSSAENEEDSEEDSSSADEDDEEKLEDNWESGEDASD